jgi:hypothetical protein
MKAWYVLPPTLKSERRNERGRVERKKEEDVDRNSNRKDESGSRRVC